MDDQQKWPRLYASHTVSGSGEKNLQTHIIWMEVIPKSDSNPPLAGPIAASHIKPW